MTDRGRVLEKLHAEAQRSTSEEVTHAGAPIVIISGMNGPSKTALMGWDLIIRFFPFRIGRVSRRSGPVSGEPDLVIPDSPPYRISQFHLSLERRNDQIILVDQESRFGTKVNGILIGKVAGGEEEIPLPAGDSQILLGGSKMPYAFQFRVIKDHSPGIFQDQVWADEHFIPVAALYNRLCHHAQYILTSREESFPECLHAAIDLITTFATNTDTTHLLYAFSTSPETFPDMIVAHSMNVAIYTVKLAQGLSYPSDETIKMGLAALFHDICLYDVPPDIIYKKDILSDHEYEVMKKHSTEGHALLAEVPDDYHAVPMVALEHHERIDGTGYPKGVTSLSEISELIAMADFFEAVTHYRPQRGPYTPHEGIRMLLQLKEAIFSPHLVKTFIREFSLFQIFSVVRLNTGEIGQVTKTDPDWPLRPIVRVVFGRDGRPVPDYRKINLSEHNNIYISRDISDRIFISHYFKL